MESERYRRGRARLEELGSGGGIERMLDPIAPDMVRFIAEFAFGDVHARPGLGKKERELVILSSLATLGHAVIELKSHVHLALNAGCSRQEVVETLMQTAVYAGFPASINALLAAGEVFRERDGKWRVEGRRRRHARRRPVKGAPSRTRRRR